MTGDQISGLTAAKSRVRWVHAVVESSEELKQWSSLIDSESLSVNYLLSNIVSISFFSSKDAKPALED